MMRRWMRRVAAVAGTVWVLPAALAAQARLPLRVYISVDMEGVTGVVTGDQTAPGQFEYERFRRIMTAEANAAIEGALEAGATEVVISDSHGNALNLLVEELNPAAQLIRAWPRPLLMMQGIDSSFAAAVFVGYHAKENTVNATLAHTMSGARIYDIRLNGRSVSEGGFNAAVAGHFGVPVVFISGDRAAVEQTREVQPNVVGVAVKEGVGTAVRTLAPSVTQRMIREGVASALRDLRAHRPFVVARPVNLEVEFKRNRFAEEAALIPGTRRVNGTTVAYPAPSMVDASRLLAAVMFLNAN